MKVPYFDFGLVPEEIKNSWIDLFRYSINIGRFINGPEVREFESNWSQYLEIRHSIGTSNGLDGLELALRSLEIGPGSRVAVPAHTFIATWLAVLNVGADPVGIDVDDSGLMNLDSLFSQKVDCVIPVHMHGSMVDMEKLTKWSYKNNVYVIEDCSQAHGAHLGGKKAGTFGDLGVFSFYPTKNLGALGDAGIIVTNNAELEKQIRLLINYGSSSEFKYKHTHLGFNRRLDSIQARILNYNLDKLEEWNKSRLLLARKYTESLDGTPYKLLQTNQSVFHHFCIIHPQRDEIKLFLENKGIQTEIHYPFSASFEIHQLLGRSQGNFPVADYLSRNLLSLPLTQWHTDIHIEYVISQLLEFINEM